MFKKSWKIYGAEGHRQRESFNESYKYDFSSSEKETRIIEVLNSDKTKTNDYSIITITRNTEEECDEELYGQLSDGIFENSRYGKVEIIKKITWEQYLELEISRGATQELAQNNIGHMMDLYESYDWDAEVPFEVE